MFIFQAEPLTIEDINPLSVRDTLAMFKVAPNLNATSKIKYAKYFEQFLSFLLLDIESPERKSEETIEDRAARSVLLEDVRRETQNCCAQLGKKRGGDIVNTRRRAEARLMSDEDINLILEKRRNLLIGTLDDNYNEYDREKINQIRDDLITVGTLKLGRRSKEMMKMTIDEVEKAEKREVNGNNIFIVKVRNQKNLKHGKEAPVVYTDKEYQVLKKYIDVLRPKIPTEKECDTVFTTIHKNLNSEISYSGIYNILQKCETNCGKKICSRSVRGSLITNSREDRHLTDQQKEDKAQSMSHTVSTADRYYNFKGLGDSVVSTLSLDQSSDTSDVRHLPSTSTAPLTSTPLKRKLDEADVTIKTLRSKKIKTKKNVVSKKLKKN